MKINFKENQIYEFTQRADEWKVHGIIVKASFKKIIIKDLIVLEGSPGDILLENWEITFPLSVRSPKCKYIGTKEDYPEYFL